MLSSEEEHSVVRKRVENFWGKLVWFDEAKSWWCVRTNGRWTFIGVKPSNTYMKFSIHSRGKKQRRFPGSENIQWRWYSSYCSCTETSPASLPCAPHQNSLRSSSLFCFPREETCWNFKRYRDGNGNLSFHSYFYSFDLINVQIIQPYYCPVRTIFN